MSIPLYAWIPFFKLFRERRLHCTIVVQSLEPSAVWYFPKGQHPLNSCKQLLREGIWLSNVIEPKQLLVLALMDLAS